MVASEKSKQIEIHRNSSPEYLDRFFHCFSINNWYIIDIINCGSTDSEPESILKYMNHTRLFNYPLKHLFLIDGYDYPSFMNKSAKYEILPMSELFIASFHQNNSSVDIYQPYKIGRKGELFIEHFGKWTPDEGMTQFYKNIPTSVRRKNFQQSEIIVSVVVKNPKSLDVKNFDDFSEVDENEPYFFQDFPNVHSLFQHLNASFSFRIFDSYGYLNHSTGRFDGMVADLYEEKGDISGTALFLSEDRQKIVDFIKTFNSWGTKFVLKKPSLSYIENIYFMTFAKQVWIASLVILFLFGAVLYILLNWEMKNKRNRKTTNKYSLGDITLISFEAVCQQGTFTDSKTYAGRILLFIMFSAFMFLYVAYSAYILVLLQSTKPIKSVRRLVDSRVECGGLNISFMMAYYTATKDDALRDLYSKKIFPNQFFTLEEGLKKVQDGNFAFQVMLGPAYNYILKKYTNQDICKLQELPGYMNTEMYIAVPKTSQYKKFFKIGLMRVDESGLQIRTKNRVSMKPKCYNEAGNFQSVRFYDCYSVFILYLSGIFVSICILLIEKVVNKYKNDKDSPMK
ncbi:unnamed protein product [Phaedon cochleariae]|uniref:Ionotropic receptor n=1 Tax=Phaedon cochleariae TaxID=80249 RepID=A0A9N9X4E4_PHACE|nr:unnamed protein product [Phaedon cochleariae]